MNFAYVVVLFFGVLGLWALLAGVPSLLLYHNKVQARANTGKRYVRFNAFKEQERVNSSQYGKPGGDIRVKKAVFTYEKNGKGVMATADNLLFEDNLYVTNGKIYTIKLSPFNPHRCYFPAYQLYRGCSIPAKIYIFVMRIIPKITGAGFLAIAWYTYTNFILK